MDLMRVIVNHGEVNALAEMFDVSLPTVRKALRGQQALRGKSSIALSQNIREAALERGGVRVREVVGNPAKSQE